VTERRVIKREELVEERNRKEDENATLSCSSSCTRVVNGVGKGIKEEVDGEEKKKD